MLRLKSDMTKDTRRKANLIENLSQTVETDPQKIYITELPDMGIKICMFNMFKDIKVMMSEFGKQLKTIQ